ncbi:MAG: cellulase family glycosylhydrolase [Clostridia bacterium]|nr:cellulase family glycosylhydrolase [Clostridia bacterium]
MEEEKNYHKKGIAAGAALAGAPAAANAVRTAAGIILTPKPAIEKEADLLKAKSGIIRDSEGNSVIFTGTNLGEAGFDCLEYGKPCEGNEKDNFAALAERFGNYGAREVFGSAYESLISASDIKSLAKAGANCVLIPLRSFLLTGNVKDKKHDLSLAHIDKILDACKKAGIYAILSLKEAPGPQNNMITRGKDGADSLFGSKKSSSLQSETVKLWAKIANRYKGREEIAAYNLLESPQADSAGDVYKLYSRIIAAVRKEKDNHIIITELPGGETAGFEKLEDDNLVIGFSGSCATVYELETFINNAVKAKETGAPVVALSFYPADYESAVSKLKAEGIGVTAGSYKGDEFCIMSGNRAVIDIKNDSFDDIKGKFADALKTKNFKKNKELTKAVFGEKKKNK